MPGFFIAFHALTALVGLFTLAAGEGYLATFGGLMTLFGLLMAYGVVKRHYDAQDAAAH
ncbi:hypothetical protein ACI6QG_13395 [Roseococcus sp. DSY-14]|uniref:hypothetical protein n=1 Tax=Roseococcus sp. DSY-14 TaxID=3369650 RepID=UPI00387B35BA